MIYIIVISLVILLFFIATQQFDTFKIPLAILFGILFIFYHKEIL